MCEFGPFDVRMLQRVTVSRLESLLFQAAPWLRAANNMKLRFANTYLDIICNGSRFPCVSLRVLCFVVVDSMSCVQLTATRN